ncbi:hypothetical protein DPMN_063269 [Dreissena polymorpha]|uniref:RING-type domain-containing protein n=1 Tax=Dreissena polymorpha TaxID=45954 RepID=A0A9D4CA70_DREPO|nr:hypothetical protein DPMN_063269 [Dreissena polymorpha]
MRRSIHNLERPFMLHNVSSQIPCRCRGDRRCERLTVSKVQSIQRENATLRQLVRCMICVSRERRVVFIPCGHLWTCEVCGLWTNVCPACGLRVTSRFMAKW